MLAFLFIGEYLKNPNQEILSEILENLLGMQSGEIDAGRGFADLGMDSLIGLRFCRKIQDALGRPVDPVWLYDHPSISQLAQFLNDHYADDHRAPA
jgi:acyl carrier protein